MGRQGRTVLILGMAFGFGVLHAGSAAAVDPTLRCQQSKLKAQGKYEQCIAKNSASVLAGEADLHSACLGKFNAALAKADQKATGAGTACRYVNNGDGTLSDLNTGLVWEQKDTTCPGTHCYSTTYSWSSSGTAPDGTAFTSFLYDLNGGTSSNGADTVTPCFTGQCDWRLPTIQELAAIVDLTATGCGSGSPCIDPAFAHTQADAYWSATTQSNVFNAWFESFFSGNPDVTDNTDNSHVRAVRGGL